MLKSRLFCLSMMSSAVFESCWLSVVCVLLFGVCAVGEVCAAETEALAGDDAEGGSILTSSE